MRDNDRKADADESPNSQQSKVAVIGVGGGGMNSLEAICTKEWPGVQFIAVNRDKLRIRKWVGSDSILLDARKNSRDCIEASAMCQDLHIRSILAGKDALILIAGLGGMTGTYATPTIARIAKTMGIKTWAVAIMPFEFEGKKRMQVAQEGIQLLKEQSVVVLAVTNQRLTKLCEENTPMLDAFRKVDEVAAKVVGSIVIYGEICMEEIDKGLSHNC